MLLTSLVLTLAPGKLVDILARESQLVGLPRLGVRSRKSLIVDVYLRSAELQEATSRSHDPETGWRLY